VTLQPSLTGHSRVVMHDVPVGVVPRRLWNDYAEPKMPDFDVCKTTLLPSSYFRKAKDFHSSTDTLIHFPELQSVTCHVAS